MISQLQLKAALTHGAARYRSAYLRQPDRALKARYQLRPLLKFVVIPDGAPGRNSDKIDSDGASAKPGVASDLPAT